MGGTQPAAAPAPVPAVARGARLASPRTAAVSGAVVLALMIAEPPLAVLARQSLNASGGSVPVWFSAAFGAVGFVVAWRRPRNPLGWLILALAGFFALSEDASFYVVASYRLRHGGLPLSWVALLAQPAWAPGIALGGLVVFLFPDGRLPSPRWRWALGLYLAVAALWAAGTVVVTVGAIASHRTAVDSGGNLLLFDNPAGISAWWGVADKLFFPLLAVGWLVSVAAQALSYRRASGERRQQLKWLLAGSALAGAGFAVAAGAGHSLLGQILGPVAFVAILAIPFCLGVAILKYRLYDIDRIVSRTLAYVIVTGLLVGVYAALVLLATGVIGLHSTVAVAAATLAAAALFNPVRRRVQRVVDRRFNRARYDADQTVAAFAARLKDAVDPDSARLELVDVVYRSLEPAHVSLWIRPG